MEASDALVLRSKLHRISGPWPGPSSWIGENKCRIEALEVELILREKELNHLVLDETSAPASSPLL